MPNYLRVIFLRIQTAFGNIHSNQWYLSCRLARAAVFDRVDYTGYTGFTIAKTITENKKLDARIRKQVIGVMREVLSDPDAGLEVTLEFTRKLKESMKAEETGKTTPLEKILKEYGV